MGTRSGLLGIPLENGYIESIDKSFASFLSTSPTNAALKDFVFHRYYLIAVSHAYYVARTLPRARSDSVERDELAMQASYEVMNAIADQILNGRFNYKARGGAPFSAYLFEAIKRCMRNPTRITVPTSFLRQGTVARETYRRVFRGNESDQQIRADLLHNQRVAEGEVNRILSEAHRHIARNRPIDHLRRSASAAAHIESLAGSAAPEVDSSFECDDARALHQAIDRLDPAQRKIIEGFYFSSQQLKAMGEELEIKNPVYEKKKATERLRAELSHLFE